MEVHSVSFEHNRRIPADYTCEGSNHSPHLAWGNLPPTTRSLAIIVDDPDAPAGTFSHWGVYDISPEMTHVDEAFSRRDAGSVGAEQVMNDFGRRGYGGPCPPRGHGQHGYRFRVLALAVPELDLPAHANVPDLERAAAPHILDEAVIIGTYER